MYYELYMDVFFLENFMMDYLMLITVRRILHCGSARWRILLGSFLGSLLTCIGILLPGGNTFYGVLKWSWLYLGVSVIMIVVGLGIRKLRPFLRAMVVLMITGILLGGVMGMLKPFFRRGLGLFFLLTVICYQVLKGIVKVMEHFRNMQSIKYMVTLCMKDKSCCINAIVDTGNLLHDPVTGKPVHIVTRRCVLRTWGNQPASGIRYVPFTSLGKENGMLPVIEMDWMYVQGENGFRIEKPLIGISSGSSAFGEEYEMILSSEIFRRF